MFEIDARNTSRVWKGLAGGVDRRAMVAGLGAAALAAPAVVRAEAPIRLKLGNDLPAAHSVNVRLGEAIDAITRESGGRLTIALFPNNRLGSDPDMLAQLRYGALEIATMPGTVLSTLIPAASLTGLGFIFKDYAKVWSAMDGDVGAYIQREIERFNLHPFEAIWDNGFRQINSGAKPIAKPEDLDPEEGLRPIGGYLAALLVGAAIVAAIPWISIGFLK